MRPLAAELDIHEAIEDAVFYPAVRTVSEDVEVAYAEHGVLADLLAATVKFPLGGAEFESTCAPCTRRSCTTPARRSGPCSWKRSA